MSEAKIGTERPTVTLPTLTQDALSAKGRGLEFYPWYETVAGCPVDTPEIMLLSMVVTATDAGRHDFTQSIADTSDMLQRPVEGLRRAMRLLEGRELISYEYVGPRSNVHTPIRFCFSPSARVVREIERDREERRPCFLRTLEEMIPLPSPQFAC